MKPAINQTTGPVSFVNHPVQLRDGSYCSSKPVSRTLQVLTLLVCLLYGLGALSQATYYVKTTGNDAGSGTSWVSAFKTLQKALATAGTTGDQIWVAAGTYYPDEGTGQTDNGRGSSFLLKNGVALYGGFAGTETQLSQRNWKTSVTVLSGDLQQNDGANFANNGDNAFHVVQGNGTNDTAVLDGFTVTAGNTIGGGSGGGRGGGIYNISSSPTISNCSFSGNTASIGAMYNDRSSPKLTNCSFSGNYGGGIFNDGSSPTLTNCSFSDNTASWGGGIANISSSPTISNCSFSDNTASAGAMFNQFSSPKLTNCSFSGNKGGGIYNDRSSPTLTNCSFFGNTASNEGGGIYNFSSSPTLTNCILWGDTGGEISSNSGSTSTIFYSIVQGAGLTTNGNKDQDPLFVDAATGNLRLRACSPAINAGNDNANSTATDLDGNPRKVGTIDMGAYEYQGSPRASILYVKFNAAGANNGTSWANAFQKLQDALAEATVCAKVTQIWVAAGTYYPDEGTGQTNDNHYSSFNLENGVALYGGFAGTETQLSQRNWHTNVTILSGDLRQNDGADFANNGENALQVVRGNNGTNNTAVLDGFTITAGHAYGERPSDRGGGIYNDGSSPTISNCSFSGNTATVGGGIYNDGSSPTLTNCSFSGNTASFGGGIVNIESSPKLTNCSFSGNTAYNGAGIYNESSSSPTLTNCSFSGNTAYYEGGGIFNIESSPKLTNCILWSNVGGQISGDPATVTYSIVQGGSTTNGNKNQDPLFVDAATGNLRLQACSPAIDAGDDYADNTTANDLDGNTRNVDAIAGGSQIDMGAYEFQGDLDVDNDGYTYCNNEDCDDTNPAITAALLWYKDADNDGYSDGTTQTQCAKPTGSKLASELTAASGDCDDADPTVNPGAVEVCSNGKDDNCNGTTDESVCYACRNATSFSTTNIICNSATLNWVSIPNPERWQVQYKSTARGSKWMNVLLLGNKRSYDVTGLARNQTYIWHIRAKCGGTWTAYSNSISFKTTCANAVTSSSASVNEVNSTLKLYPNPAKGQFVIELHVPDKINTNAKIQLVNMMGQTVSAENARTSNGVLQKRVFISSSITSGIYIVRIIANNKTYQARLIYEK